MEENKPYSSGWDTDNINKYCTLPLSWQQQLTLDKKYQKDQDQTKPKRLPDIYFRNQGKSFESYAGSYLTQQLGIFKYHLGTPYSFEKYFQELKRIESKAKKDCNNQVLSSQKLTVSNELMAFKSITELVNDPILYSTIDKNKDTKSILIGDVDVILPKVRSTVLKDFLCANTKNTFTNIDFTKDVFPEKVSLICEAGLNVFNKNPCQDNSNLTVLQTKLKQILKLSTLFLNLKETVLKYGKQFPDLYKYIERNYYLKLEKIKKEENNFIFVLITNSSYLDFKTFQTGKEKNEIEEYLLKKGKFYYICYYIDFSRTIEIKKNLQDQQFIQETINAKVKEELANQKIEFDKTLKDSLASQKIEFNKILKDSLAQQAKALTENFAELLRKAQDKEKD